MRKIAVKLATGLVLLWPLAIPHDAATLTTQEIEQMVAQFFPQRLIDESDEDFQQGGPEPFRASNYRLADLDRTGTANYIVAAYTNGFSAVVRVLKVQNSTATLVAEPNLRLLSGVLPGIQLIDVEGDGRPEVVISLTGPRAPVADWVFKWTGTELALIGPVVLDESGDPFTDLVNSAFDDIDGDGILEIIRPPLSFAVGGADGGIPTDTYTVFRFDGQRFAPVKPLNFFRTFYRRTAAPVLETSEFEVANPGPGFVLTIVNGNRNGDNRVSSGTIKLNGVVVLTPDDLNQQVRKVIRQVTTLAENTLEVELAAKPSGQVLITVEPPPR